MLMRPFTTKLRERPAAEGLLSYLVKNEAGNSVKENRKDRRFIKSINEYVYTTSTSYALAAGEWL